MLERFRSLLRAPEEKVSRVARLIALETGGRARWTPRDYAALAREGYAKNAIVYRAVKLVAESAGALTFLLYDGAAERDRHPLLDLLARPNPRQDGAALFESVYTHLLLAGNAYLEAVALEGAVRELYALRPDRMRVVPGADGWPAAYDYTAGGRRSRRQPSRSTRTTPPRAGTRRCSTTPRGPPARSSMPGRRARCSRTRSSSASSASSRPPIRAAPTPAGRCCSKAASTGRRCR
jgi:phage portal protein BeeE